MADEVIYLDLKDGRVTIKLRPDLAPNHVARIKELVGQGFYDGLKFHRVIDGFMAQTGDPKGNGTGGSGNGSPPPYIGRPIPCAIGAYIDPNVDPATTTLKDATVLIYHNK